MTISSPPAFPLSGIRSVECQRSMQEAFDGLISQALAAGWSKDDVAFAVMDLALNQMKGRVSNEDRHRRPKEMARLRLV